MSVLKYDDGSFPKVFFEKTYRWVFGILKIYVLVEDRRPDLKLGEYDGKYKTQVSVFLFGKRIFSTYSRAPYKGGIYINPDSSLTKCELDKAHPNYDYEYRN